MGKYASNLSYVGYGVNTAAVLFAAQVQEGKLATRFVWVVYGLVMLSMTLVFLGKMVRQ